MRHPDDPVDDRLYFRAVIGRLWAVGIPVDLAKLHVGSRRRVPLPTYPFQHAKYWIDPGRARNNELTAPARPMALSSIDDWYWQPKWVQRGIVEPGSRHQKWLVFHTNDPATLAVVKELREKGKTVVTVQAGDTFARVDAHSYTLAPEAGGTGYQELIEDLATDDLLPECVVHTWLLTRDENFRPGSSFLHRNQEYGFYSLFHLARALGKTVPADEHLDLVIVGNGVQQVCDEEVSHPEKATVLGPCAVIPREFPNISCKFVDIDSPTSTPKRNRKRLPHKDAGLAGTIGAIQAEIDAPAENIVVAWRSGVRWQRFISRWRVAPDCAGTQRVKKRGVYLITGGFGGIASEVARWLAKDYDARLILVGRTPLPSRDQWDSWLTQHGREDSIGRAIVQVQQLEALGARVLPMAADVTVTDQMREVVHQARQVFGAIDGVFHTAGLIRDNLIQLKSQRDIEEVFAAKLYGTIVLDEIFRRSPLDFMVLFSSTSAFIAPQGQVDYVGASAFVNAFASSCAGRRPYPVSAVNWGIWRDVGLVAAPPRLPTSHALDAEMQHTSRHAMEHPVFQCRHSSHEGIAQLHIFAGYLSTSEHWLVDDHRLGTGEALLPGTGYIEFIRAGLVELGYPEHGQINNLVCQSPLFVVDQEKREFRLRFYGGRDQWDVKVFGRLAVEGVGDSWELCATAKVGSELESTAYVFDREALETRCNASVKTASGSARLRTRQEDHLKFGLRWKVLRELRLGTGQALAHLQLPESCVEDLLKYSLHPALLDIATGCAMDLIPGYASQDHITCLWVPLSYRRVRCHAPLEEEIYSWIRIGKDVKEDTEFVDFDILVANRNGDVLVEIEQLTLRRTESGLPRNQIRGGQVSSTANDDALVGRASLRSPAEEALQHNISQGISAHDGIEALKRLINGRLPPVPIVSSMELPALILQADALSSIDTRSDDTRFARPELDSDFEPPRDEIERSLADLWGRLLGVEGLGIRDSFFDLGGHSLIAVRLFNEISDRYGIELPMSVLLQSPDIAGLGELIRGEAYGIDPSAEPDVANVSGRPATPKHRFRHIVPMHTGPVSSGTPLFLVAGMFGNVLNLSHLAHLLGEDRPFFALQARGLYGDAEPHETFEEMARDYILELRQVQPTGPYLLGGFSGGGLIAFEMARQLIEQGDTVIKVIMLDTPVRDMPNFSFADRISMFMQGLRAGGANFISDKIKGRIAWERQKRGPRDDPETSQHAAQSFQSQRIGDAFVRALIKYDVPRVPVDIAVFRPKLDVRFRLSGGRLVDSQRNFVARDNGWTNYVRSIDVYEVPGNHDSMVLEPNVRVLVSLLKRAIEISAQKVAKQDSEYDA